MSEGVENQCIFSVRWITGMGNARVERKRDKDREREREKVEWDQGNSRWCHAVVTNSAIGSGVHSFLFVMGRSPRSAPTNLDSQTV